ncbi:hypothetical protein BSEG_04673, partial [Phocaeicola dorei 5_1_36/D4]
MKKEDKNHFFVENTKKNKHFSVPRVGFPYLSCSIYKIAE